MFKGVKNVVKGCYSGTKAQVDDQPSPGASLSYDDPMVWSRELEKHNNGEFSFAVVHVNELSEDQSQVEVSNDKTTFVGIYDGHNGFEASVYLMLRLYHHFKENTKDGISGEAIRRAITQSDIEYQDLAAAMLRNTRRPVMIQSGSCCLVGVVCRRKLYIANLGDSRAVMGVQGRSRLYPEDLTWEHTASKAEVRNELRETHPQDSSILIMEDGVWRIKGMIQVSRSIGDCYLKDPELALDKNSKFYLEEPIRRSVLTAEPAIITRRLTRSDRFLIFASAGLWENLTSEEAVNIVDNNPRMGIARRLIERALKNATASKNIRYKDLLEISREDRRQFHDDITVVVLFLDHYSQDAPHTEPVAELSCKFRPLQEETGESSRARGEEKSSVRMRRHAYIKSLPFKIS